MLSLPPRAPVTALTVLVLSTGLSACGMEPVTPTTADESAPAPAERQANLELTAREDLDPAQLEHADDPIEYGDEDLFDLMRDRCKALAAGQHDERDGDIDRLGAKRPRADEPSYEEADLDATDLAQLEGALDAREVQAGPLQADLVDGLEPDADFEHELPAACAYLLD